MLLEQCNKEYFNSKYSIGDEFILDGIGGYEDTPLIVKLKSEAFMTDRGIEVLLDESNDAKISYTPIANLRRKKLAYSNLRSLMRKKGLLDIATYEDIYLTSLGDSLKIGSIVYFKERTPLINFIEAKIDSNIFQLGKDKDENIVVNYKNCLMIKSLRELYLITYIGVDI